MKRYMTLLLLTSCVAQSFGARAIRNDFEQTQFKAACNTSNVDMIHQIMVTSSIPQGDLGLALCTAVFYQRLTVVNALLEYKYLMDQADIEAARHSAVNQQLWNLADLLQ